MSLSASHLYFFRCVLLVLCGRNTKWIGQRNEPLRLGVMGTSLIVACCLLSLLQILSGFCWWAHRRRSGSHFNLCLLLPVMLMLFQYAQINSLFHTDNVLVSEGHLICPPLIGCGNKMADFNTLHWTRALTGSSDPPSRPRTQHVSKAAECSIMGWNRQKEQFFFPFKAVIVSPPPPPVFPE